MNYNIKTKKIVLAEEEPIIAEILPQFLKPIGYDVIVSSDGKEALETINRELPDLIIIDSDLTKIDGFSLCKILKSSFLTSYIPMIILIEKKKIRKKILEIPEGIDDYIFKPPDPIDLQIRLEMALRRTDHQVHANSLTRLPGNKAIEITSRNHIDSGKPFAFMYLDIDNFKSFNDTYGYFRGDGVLMQMARILTNCVGGQGNSGDFVGHVGGDDFIVITSPDKGKILAKEIILEFDRLMPLLYSKHDRVAGYLMVRNRQGDKIKAPIMGLSVAIVDNTLHKINNLIELTEIASEIKKHLKTLKGSNYLVNRRKVNKKDGMQKHQGQGTPYKAPPYIYKEDSSTLPVGQLLLKANLINEKQLQEALFEHWSSRKLLGQTLIKMGLIEKDDLESFLAKNRI